MQPITHSDTNWRDTRSRFGPPMIAGSDISASKMQGKMHLSDAFVREMAKRAVKRLLVASGAIEAARRFGPHRSITILRYHAVTNDTNYADTSISVTPQLFERHLRHLASRYDVISLDDVLHFLRSGAPPARSAVCITFDDGYIDNYENAFPLLKKYGLAATFYVTAGPVVRGERFWVGWLQKVVTQASDLAPLYREFGFPLPASTTGAGSNARHRLIDNIGSLANRAGIAERDAVIERVERALGAGGDTTDIMMRPTHLVEMQQAGMTIGAHSVTHPILANLSVEDASVELSESKALLESVLRTEIRHIAYPNGPGVKENFNSETMRIAREAGYASGSTSIRGIVGTESEPLALNRQGINQRLDPASFAFKLQEHRFAAADGRP